MSAKSANTNNESELRQELVGDEEKQLQQSPVSAENSAADKVTVTEKVNTPKKDK